MLHTFLHFKLNFYGRHVIEERTCDGRRIERMSRDTTNPGGDEWKSYDASFDHRSRRWYSQSNVNNTNRRRRSRILSPPLAIFCNIHTVGSDVAIIPLGGDATTMSVGGTCLHPSPYRVPCLHAPTPRVFTPPVSRVFTPHISRVFTPSIPCVFTLHIPRVFTPPALVSSFFIRGCYL